MELSPGKYRGMQRLADANGTFKMVAMDQRTPILGPIARIRGTTLAPYEDVARFKELLAEHLSPLASAVLVDPIYAFPATLPLIGRGPGLILTLEHSAVEETPLGRKSLNIPDWSVDKAKRAGADAVKILVWYRADADAAIKEHQQAFVQACGEACRAADVAHVLEVLVYPLPGESPDTVVANRARLVSESVVDFCRPEYRVDIFKLEPPGPLHDVPDPDGPQAAKAQAVFDALAKQVTAPWVLLSAGAGTEDFLRSLVYSYRAGASGYLCGRAIWQRAFERFPDFDAIGRTLSDEFTRNLERINALTDELANSWSRHGSLAPAPAVQGAGADFPTRYEG